MVSGDGPISLFLEPSLEPLPVCIGCLFQGGLGQQLQPTTVYEISKGGVTTPLDGVDGVTVNDNNGTLFVEDTSAVFAEGDELRCTYMSTTHISSIVQLGIKAFCVEPISVLYSTVFLPPTLNPSGRVDITEGDNLTLSCQDPGNTNVETYQWVNDSSGEDLGD